ncbi:MAG: nucleotidyltransferase, partial [bacterium]|nr:nucleotidyltransferase [bacterium]
MTVQTPRDVPIQKVEDLCKKWGITELALFGSILRDDFGPDSDVDVLVSFTPNVSLSLFDF